MIQDGLALRLQKIIERCSRDRRLYGAVVKTLMYTVEFEDKLAKRSKRQGNAALNRILSGPWDNDLNELEEVRAIPVNEFISYLQNNSPLLVAFETVLGELLYVVDRGCAKIAIARERGVKRVPVEVYSPPYRIPRGGNFSLRRIDSNWVSIVGGTPPEVVLPVKREETDVILSLLELRGLKTSARREL